MSNTLLIKRSNAPGSVPLAANLALGEIALNYTDGNLFYKNNSGVVTVLASNQFVSVSGNITGGNVTTGGVVTATGNITGGNMLTAGLISATSTITSAANITGGNLLTGGLVSATGNVTGGNITTAGLITSTGNITGGNLLSVGLMSSVGNIHVGTANAGYVFGNAAFMTGISAAVSVTKIENGNSNVSVVTAGGDVTVAAGGIGNVAVFSTGSLSVKGAIGNPKTMTGNVVISEGINATLVGPIEWDVYNLTVPDSSTVYIIPG